MNDKSRNDKEVVEAFERLFDDSLVPTTLEEANETIRNAGIDPDKFRDRMRRLTQRLLAESPNNWRNQSMDEIEAVRRSLAETEMVQNLSFGQLLGKIKSLRDKFPRLFPGEPQYAHRNLTGQSEEDLAYLLQEMLYRVKQAGFDVDKDE